MFQLVVQVSHSVIPSVHVPPSLTVTCQLPKLRLKAGLNTYTSGNTNLAQSRPNLLKSYRQILLTASWPAYILTMDVTRHFTGIVHDKRLQM